MNTVQAARTMAGVWVLVATTLLSLHQATAAPIVDAPWGRIRGLDSVSVSGLNYSSYLAIPYALPPVGELRFAKPVAHPGYGNGQDFNATSQGAQCWQVISAYASASVRMSEDCLTLNVFVPVSPSNGPKSVMVWIHGGGFTVGGASIFTPSELVTEDDVIVVVIQYRLDALGFLSSGDDTVPGNFGLWDQNLALRWVKTNIAAFGGDPESMTVFGESAGGASVGYQMSSPASKGLKFRGILQSGTPLAPWAFSSNPTQTFYSLAKQTGCLASKASCWSSSISYYFNTEAQEKEERERAMACLRRLDASVLVRPTEFPEGDVTLSSLLVWASACGRRRLRAPGPAQLMSDVAYLDGVGATERDVMIGVNNEEGALLLGLEDGLAIDSYTPEEKGRFERFIQIGNELERNLLTDQLVFLYGEDLMKEPRRLDTLVNVLEFSYTNWANNGAGTATLKNVVDTFSDMYWVVNSVKFAKHLASAKAKISGFRSPLGRHYLYLFNHYPAYKAGQPVLRGTSHSEDVAYAFDPLPALGSRQGFTGDEYVVGSTFRSMLASFAKTGQPQVPLVNSAVNVWPEYTLTEERYLSLERVPRVDDHLFGKRVALWTDLLPSLYNSTQEPEPVVYRTRHQQQRQPWGCRSPAWRKMARGVAKTFTFNGGLTHPKLP